MQSIPEYGMKIECCACGREYTLEGNLFQGSPVRQEPILLCPHCGFQHFVSFLPVPRPFSPPSSADPKPHRPPLDKLKLITYYISIHACRIANATRVDQSGADDANVTSWDRTADFILSFHVTADKTISTRNYKLLFRDVTDDDAFADVAGTGEINYTATTDLVNNGFDSETTYRLCTQPSGYDWSAVRESEGDNALSGSFTQAYSQELQWALSPSAADYSHEYAFQLFDVSEGAAIGVAGSTITMAADPSGQSQAPRSMHQFALRRS
jgi:hypothetical protein